MPNQNSLNNLLQDLIRLVPISDEVISYWASDALSQLTQLRSLAGQRGFAQWSFTNMHLLGADPSLTPVLKSTQNALRKLADLLEDKSVRVHVDGESSGAASRIYKVVRSDAVVNSFGLQN